MSTLWRYVATRFLTSFLGAFLILALVLLVVDMLLGLDEILEAHASLRGAVEFLFLRLAALYLPYLVPVAVFAGAFVSLGQAARAREVIAMKAGGISPRRAVVPVLALAVLLSGLTLVLTEAVTVRAAAAIHERSGQPTDISLRSGTIWYHTGRFIYNIRDPDPDSEAVRDVRVLERNERGRLVRVIHARKATRLRPRHWRFEDATVRRFDPDHPAAEPEVERAATLDMELAEERSPRLLESQLSGLSLATLSRYVGQVLDHGGDPGRAREVLHQRLTIPFLVLLFALLAVPLGLRVEQTRSLSLPALEGVIVLFVFVSLREYGPALAPGVGVSAAAALWSVVALFFAYGTWSFLRIPR